MVGEAFGHYVIVDRLGEGGMGTVCRAHDTLLDRTMALKVLHQGGDADSARRLLREARAASALNHPPGMISGTRVCSPGAFDGVPV